LLFSLIFENSLDFFSEGALRETKLFSKLLDQNITALYLLSGSILLLVVSIQVINLRSLSRLHQFLLQIKVFLQNFINLQGIKERKLSTRSLPIAAIALRREDLISFIWIEHFFRLVLNLLDVHTDICEILAVVLVLKARINSTICINPLDRYLTEIFDISGINCLYLKLLILLLEILGELEEIFVQQAILFSFDLRNSLQFFGALIEFIL